MKGGWVFFVAKRYIRSTRKDKRMSASVLTVGGIGVGVMTLIAVMSVMNGFQMGFIQDILEINSYHLRIKNQEISGQELAEIRDMADVRAAIPFKETQTIIKGEYSDFYGAMIKGLPEDGFLMDSGLFKEIGYFGDNSETDEAPIISEGSIIIGIELAQKLGAREGDSVYIVAVGKGSDSSASPIQRELVIQGYFRSGFYEYDSTLSFVSLNTFDELGDSSSELILGIKLKNRFQDQKITHSISGMLLEENAEILSWREFNKSFFGALRMEKLMMLILVGLIFIVVGINIYHSLKRAVFERTEEVGLLKAIGATPEEVRMIFVIDGVIIGFMGSFLGTVTGLLLATRINELFSWIEGLLVKLFPRGGGLFSPRYFYMADIPVRIVFQEILLITGFAALSAIAAAYFASKRITEIKPSEVLRYE